MYGKSVSLANMIALLTFFAIETFVTFMKALSPLHHTLTPVV